MSATRSASKSTPSRSSPAKVAANRRNGAMSRGPVTEPGKAISGRNAIKHGLCAAIPVLPGEDPTALENRRAAWIDALGPTNAVELFLVENAVAASWGLDRARRLEAQAAVAAAPQAAPEPVLDPRQVARDLLTEPARAVAELRAGAEGLRYLRDRWQLLADQLATHFGLDLDELKLALALLGRTASDADLRTDPLARRVIALGLHRTCTQVPGDEVDPMDEDEAYERSLEAWAEALGTLTGWHQYGRELALRRYRPEAERLLAEVPEPDEALAALAELIRGQIAELDERLAQLAAADPDVPPLADPLRDPGTALRLRYAGQHERSLLKNLSQLAAIRKAGLAAPEPVEDDAGDAPEGRPPAPPVATADPTPATPDAASRNEPNHDASLYSVTNSLPATPFAGAPAPGPDVAGPAFGAFAVPISVPAG